MSDLDIDSAFVKGRRGSKSETENVVNLFFPYFTNTFTTMNGLLNPFFLQDY